MKASSRYSSYDTRSSTTSSHFSDPSSSSEFHHSSKSSRAVVKPKPSNIAPTAMLKKLMMEKKPKSGTKLFIPCDFIAQDLKKDVKKVNALSALHNKLFGNGNVKEKNDIVKKKKKALTEVKENTRTLAMVLRSERELLNMNKDQELEISKLKLVLEEKNQEVEKLKDLCLKQREEIRSLKSAVLFPDVMSSQLQELVEKQGSELKQAKQVIPVLQHQVTSLTGQLQSLAQDLSEVKADKYSAKTGTQGYENSPRTPTEDASNSWEFSSEDSSDDLLLKDLNPCLTPYKAKSRRSRESEGMGSGSLHSESLSGDDAKVYSEMNFSSYDSKFSRSSDCCQNSNKRSVTTKPGRRSDESKLAYGGRRNHKLG